MVSVLAPLMFLVLLMLAAVLVAFALILSRRPKVKTPSCGRCEYDVTGLTELRCPECGSDLREVGILTARIGRGPRPATVAILSAVVWTLILAITASIVTPLLDSVLPRTFVSDEIVMLTTRPGASLSIVVLELKGTGPSRGPADEVTVRLQDATGARSRGLRMDLPVLAHRIERADGSWTEGAGSLDAERLASWLEKTSGQSPRNDLGAAARDLLTIIGNYERQGQLVVQGGYYNGASMTGSTTVLPRAWLVPTVLTVWLVVWLIGLGGIVRRARRQRQLPA